MTPYRTVGLSRVEAQRKVFVGGLSWDTTKETLLSYFSQYGEVVDCVVMKNPETGKSRGFGFVTYKDTNCVETILSVPAHIVDGRQVDPKACNPKGPNRGGGGGGQEGGGGQRMQRGPRGQDPMKDRKIFVGGLPNNADEDAIKNFFSRYGNVLDVTVMYDAQKQRSRGFGFLTFESEEAVDQVCREHYIHFNGKKVECKRATPRDNRGNQGQQEEPQMQIPPHALGLPHLEMGGHPPPQHAQGPVPGPEWAQGPPEVQWNQQPQQGPPPQLGGPPQFQNVQFQGAFQTDQPQSVQPGAWPPTQQPGQSPGAWPPGGLPPPQQQGTPVSPPYFTQQSGVAQTFSSSPAFQPPPGAPVYQWAASPPQQPPPANGQAPPGAMQPPPNTYSYAPPTYASPAVAAPGLAPRQYQEYNGQVQMTTTVSAVQAPGPAPVSTPVSYSAYPSPYVAHGQQAAGTIPADPYAQPTAVAPPQGAVQIAAPPGGQPGYGSPLGQTALAAADPSAPKPVDYSAYYSAYGYGGDPAASAAYTAQPAQVPVQYAGQGEPPQAVAYGAAPGPSPTFQRQSSAPQAFHPYARR